MVVECPAVRPGALPAVMEIPHFAVTLKVGEFRAVDVARDEEYKEFPLLVLQPLGTFITSLHLLSLSGTLLTRAGGLLRYSG